jgi:DNA-binding NarL/FixJ family response regulator
MDARRFGAMVDTISTSWGRGATVTQFAPGHLSDDRFVEWWARFERLSASPTSATLLARMTAEIDVRKELEHINCPVLVIHRAEDPFAKSDVARNLARSIPGARLVELPGRDHPIWLGDNSRLVDEVAEFLTGERPAERGTHVLAALLVTRVAGLQDSDDRRHLDERLELWRDAVPKVLSRYSAQAELSEGGTFIARLDSASRAVACSVALQNTAAFLGLAIAQGIHVSEIDSAHASLSGPSLEIPAKIASTARSGEILMSRLASDLVSGSGLRFIEHHAVNVDGVDGPVSMVAVATERHHEPMGHHVSAADLGTLSPRERQVLALVAEGLSNPAIAVQLSLSQHTVKRHVANILLKLDLPSRAAAALIARHPAG